MPTAIEDVNMQSDSDSEPEREKLAKRIAYYRKLNAARSQSRQTSEKPVNGPVSIGARQSTTPVLPSPDPRSRSVSKASEPDTAIKTDPASPTADDGVWDFRNAPSMPIKARSPTPVSRRGMSSSPSLPPPPVNTRRNDQSLPAVPPPPINTRRDNESPPALAKRPARESPTILPLKKAKPTPAVASSSASVPSRANESNSTQSVRQPDWYQRLHKSTTRSKQGDTSIDHKLGYLRRCITRYVDAGNTATNNADQSNLVDAIHDAMFLQVTGQLLRDNTLLHPAGLPRLFDENANPAAARLPFYLRADAYELYTKWAARKFDANLLHHIIVGKGKSAILNRDKTESDRLDKDYAERVYGTFFGNGTLTNGQWWPTQLCTVRDGAHNSAQGGISGRDGEGAYSIVVSGDPRYPDIDEGDRLLYCGTDADTDGSAPKVNTQHMIESVNRYKKDPSNTSFPIRVFRSQHAKNKALAPSHGFRYDGLYDAVNYRFWIRRFRGTGLS